MTIKEKPLIDAGSRGAGVPKFFFANPFLAGFFGALVAAVLGAICIGIPGSYFAAGDNVALLNAVMIGALVAMAIGIIANIYRREPSSEDEEASKDGTEILCGNILAVAIMLPILWFAHDPLLNLLNLISQSQAEASVLPRWPGT